MTYQLTFLWFFFPSSLWLPMKVLSTRIVAVKASLCKLSSATAARACDFHAKLLLIAISSTLKSLLRPHVLNTPDKSPGDRLSEICAKNTDTGNIQVISHRIFTIYITLLVSARSTGSISHSEHQWLRSKPTIILHIILLLCHRI